ncbi:MAG: hypothetical protein FWF79_00340 [Defluviitaleaceae bacterium]|nr:hypothetical protein [Defluviitaleaceae bacterium]
MKCPNCQKNFSKGNTCPHCKVDAVLYMGTVQLSDKLHNKGLERLKAGDFYHAIEVLNKSLAINKNNVPSRNLLGLALFEVGHIGEALKHWVISQSLLPEDNPATQYIDTANKSSRKLEQLNDAVGMYNQALGHIKQKSDDLAIIQLKKAVEINPRFVDALNLLTLCYLIQNDRERAIATAERTISFDTLNPIALNYYTTLNPGKKRPARQTPADTPVSRQQANSKGPYKSIGLEEKKPKNFHLAELLTFLIGAICTAAACYFLLIPVIERAHESDMEQAQLLLIDTRAEHHESLQQLAGEKEELQQEISNLGSEIHELALELSDQQRINHVHQAYRFYLAEDLRRAVDMLDDFNSEFLPPDIRELADMILESAYPQLGAEYYAAGLAAFNANDSYGALSNLNQAFRFLDDESAQWNMLLFMLGTVHYRQENTDTAFVFLMELQERAAPNFPGFTGTQTTAIRTMIANIEDLR